MSPKEKEYIVYECLSCKAIDKFIWCDYETMHCSSCGETQVKQELLKKFGYERYEPIRHSKIAITIDDILDFDEEFHKKDGFII